MSVTRQLIFAFLFLGIVSAASAEESRLRIGMILPLSGDFAVIGADGRQGVELALREHVGQAPFEVVYGDSKGDPAASISEFRKLVDSERVAGVFAFRGPVGMALNPLSKQVKLPLLGGVGNKSFAEQNSYAFQIWAPADVEGSFIAAEMWKRGYKSVALITSEDDWTVSVSDSFSGAFKATGGAVAFEQSLSPKDGEFRSLITQLKKADPAAVFVNLGISQIGTFLRQLKEQGINKPVFSNFWSAKKDVILAAGDAADGVLFSEMSLAAMPKFSAAIAANGGGNPSGATLSAYVATKLFLQAASNDVDTPAALYNALLAQHEVRLADMSLLIKERVVSFPLAMKVIQGGKAVPAQ